MTETIEKPELQIVGGGDGPDEQEPGWGEGGLPKFHTILQVWREVLAPIESEKDEQPAPAYANRICAEYREINYADLLKVRDDYFARLIALRETLHEIIDSDEECLTHTTPEEDLENNGHHYRELLMRWQVQMAEWEKAWRCDAPDAAIQMATISEVHKMFFSPTGLVNFLDGIKFEFTDEDRQELTDRINEVKAR